LLHSEYGIRRGQSDLPGGGARDLVRGTDEYLEGAALAMISLHLGLVTEAADLLAAWSGA
jgi:hypothetical protein